MMAPALWFPPAALACCMAALAWCLLVGTPLGARARGGVVLALLLAACLPLGRSSSFLGMLWGVLGSPSMPTLAVALAALSGSASLRRDVGWGAALLALLGLLLLYPLSLGPWDLDPYRWGFAPWVLSGALAAVGIAVSFCLPALALLLGLALAGFGLRLSGSDNLWDYVLDPMLVIYSVFFLSNRLRRGLLPRGGFAS